MLDNLNSIQPYQERELDESQSQIVRDTVQSRVPKFLQKNNLTFKYSQEAYSILFDAFLIASSGQEFPEKNVAAFISKAITKGLELRESNIDAARTKLEFLIKGGFSFLNFTEIAKCREYYERLSMRLVSVSVSEVEIFLYELEQRSIFVKNLSARFFSSTLGLEFNENSVVPYFLEEGINQQRIINGFILQMILNIYRVPGEYNAMIISDIEVNNLLKILADNVETKENLPNFIMLVTQAAIRFYNLGEEYFGVIESFVKNIIDKVTVWSNTTAYNNYQQRNFGQGQGESKDAKYWENFHSIFDSFPISPILLNVHVSRDLDEIDTVVRQGGKHIWEGGEEVYGSIIPSLQMLFTVRSLLRLEPSSSTRSYDTSRIRDGIKAWTNYYRVLSTKPVQLEKWSAELDELRNNLPEDIKDERRPEVKYSQSRLMSLLKKQAEYTEALSIESYAQNMNNASGYDYLKAHLTSQVERISEKKAILEKQTVHNYKSMNNRSITDIFHILDEGTIPEFDENNIHDEIDFLSGLKKRLTGTTYSKSLDNFIDVLFDNEGTSIALIEEIKKQRDGLSTGSNKLIQAIKAKDRGNVYALKMFLLAQIDVRLYHMRLYKGRHRELSRLQKREEIYQTALSMETQEETEKYLNYVGLFNKNIRNFYQMSLIDNVDVHDDGAKKEFTRGFHLMMKIKRKYSNKMIILPKRSELLGWMQSNALQLRSDGALDSLEDLYYLLRSRNRSFPQTEIEGLSLYEIAEIIESRQNLFTAKLNLNKLTAEIEKQQSAGKQAARIKGYGHQVRRLFSLEEVYIRNSDQLFLAESTLLKSMKGAQLAIDPSRLKPAES